jgi:hypothetical protein
MEYIIFLFEWLEYNNIKVLYIYTLTNFAFIINCAKYIIYTCKDTNIQRYKYVYIYRYTYIYIYTHTPVHIYTYIHIHIYIYIIIICDIYKLTLIFQENYKTIIAFFFAPSPQLRTRYNLLESDLNLGSYRFKLY